MRIPFFIPLIFILLSCASTIGNKSGFSNKYKQLFIGHWCASDSINGQNRIYLDWTISNEKHKILTWEKPESIKVLFEGVWYAKKDSIFLQTNPSMHYEDANKKCYGMIPYAFQSDSEMTIELKRLVVLSKSKATGVPRHITFIRCNTHIFQQNEN